MEAAPAEELPVTGSCDSLLDISDLTRSFGYGASLLMITARGIGESFSV